jgi:hypothetical protein
VPLKDVNHAFDLMREGQVNPLGGSVLIDHL